MVISIKMLSSVHHCPWPVLQHVLVNVQGALVQCGQQTPKVVYAHDGQVNAGGVVCREHIHKQGLACQRVCSLPLVLGEQLGCVNTM